MAKQGKQSLSSSATSLEVPKIRSSHAKVLTPKGPSASRKLKERWKRSGSDLSLKRWARDQASGDDEQAKVWLGNKR